MKVRFKFKEDKKHSIRYNEIDSDGNDVSEWNAPHVIGAIYIQKNSEIGRLRPTIIEVDIQAVKA